MLFLQCRANLTLFVLSTKKKTLFRCMVICPTFNWNYALVGNCQIGGNLCETIRFGNLCETVRFGNLEVEETWWIFNNSSRQGEAGERKDKLISFQFFFGKDIEATVKEECLWKYESITKMTQWLLSTSCLCDILNQRAGS